jgi:hypothetical protein
MNPRSFQPEQQRELFAKTGKDVLYSKSGRPLRAVDRKRSGFQFGRKKLTYSVHHSSGDVE